MRKKESKEGQEIGIGAALAALNSELWASAEKRTDDWQPLFRVKEARVELQVMASKSVDAQGGVNFHVVSIGAKGTESELLTHKVIVTLEPLPGDNAQQADLAKLTVKGRNSPKIQG